MGPRYDYNRPRSTALRLIDKYGIDAELRVAGTSHRYDVKITFLDYSSRQVDGSRVKIGDFQGLIPAASVRPKSGSPPLALPPGEGDQLFWGGKLRQIMNGSVLRPGPSDVTYTVQIRGPR